VIAMKSYIVNVRRTLVQEFSIEVEASSPEQARIVACESAVDERPALWHGAKVYAQAIKVIRGIFA